MVVDVGEEARLGVEVVVAGGVLGRHVPGGVGPCGVAGVVGAGGVSGWRAAGGGHCGFCDERGGGAGGEEGEGGDGGDAEGGDAEEGAAVGCEEVHLYNQGCTKSSVNLQMCNARDYTKEGRSGKLVVMHDA